MTKLTQQEVEQERVKFEKWFFNFYLFEVSKQFVNEKNIYRNELTNTHWHPWLARAELAKEE